MKIGVLLSGSGVYDGSEIQEAVFTLLAIDKNKAEAVCFAPNVEQHHVINHTNGEEMDEKRNVLIEAARIARGEIKNLSDVTVSGFDALAIVGGFGAAKNLTKWAFSGPEGEILPEVKSLITTCVKAGIPIAGMCMGPTVIAKALQGTEVHAVLTVGSTEASSPYEIGAISEGMEVAGATAVMKTVQEINIDAENKIVTAPCYMMDASITEVQENIQTTIDALLKLI